MAVQFSVIIPTFNRSAMLRKTLETVVAQQFDSYEIIVVDDGGTDNTAAMIESLNNSRIQYYWKENEERGIARNFGASKSTGQYLNFFDSDDFMLSNHLTTASKIIIENPKVQWFALGYEFIDFAGRKLRTEDYSKYSISDLPDCNFMSMNAVFMARHVWEQTPFEPERAFITAEDWVMWLRLAAQHQLLLVPEITSQIVQHQQRSINVMSPKKLIASNRIFRSKIQQPLVRDFLGGRRGNTMATIWLYEALNLAMFSRYKLRALACIVRAAFYRPAVLFRRRFLATLKHQLITWR